MELSGDVFRHVDDLDDIYTSYLIPIIWRLDRLISKEERGEDDYLSKASRQVDFWPTTLRNRVNVAIGKTIQVCTGSSWG